MPIYCEFTERLSHSVVTVWYKPERQHLAKTPDKDREAARRNTRMRFEQWARNPACEANTVSAVRNVRLADVAKAAGLPISFGQSPFAIARGNQFEKALFYDDAKRLIENLVAKEVLPAGAKGMADFRLRINGGSRLKYLDEAIAETMGFIRNLSSLPAKKRSQMPAIVAGATVRIPKGVLLPEATLIIDALAVRTDTEKPILYVGEVKTYPDRGGHTDSGELATARAQAGIYVHGLDLVVKSLGADDKVDVSREGFLVLTRPGSNWPSVRAGEDLRYQATRAERGFELLERAAAELSSDLWALEEAEPPQELTQAVLEADTSYSEACLSFCDLAPRCFENAVESGDPIILGEIVRRFVGDIPLPRVMELLEGAEPATVAERDLVGRIAESDGMRGL